MAKLPETIREGVDLPRQSLRWAWRTIQRASESSSRQPALPDVWKWTGRKYRIRAVVLLLINAVLFAGLGCFTFWLRNGYALPFLGSRYWELWWSSFDPTLEQQATLVDFLLNPIPVVQVPLMMVIAGLVLASLTAIPIMVSMLYRFPFSLIFTGIIGFIALLPWLAITVTICCYLARWRRIQFSFRYATALISLLPMVAYYALATRNPSGIQFVPPLDLPKLYLPWVLALIAACLVMAIVLVIARMVNYRPGAIAPLMAVLFAIPVVLFETKVGRDELSYRLLEKQLGPHSREYFPGQVNAEEMIYRAAEMRRDSMREPQPPIETLVEQIRVVLQFQQASGQTEQNEISRLLGIDFLAQREAAKAQCERFGRHFPKSRYIPNVLYLEGRALDLRLDRQFTFQHAQGLIYLHYHDDFPNAGSRPVWQMLYAGFPGSPLVSVALYRLAVFAARDGQVKTAIDLLTELNDRFGTAKPVEPSVASPGGWLDFLAKRPASGLLDVDPPTVVLSGQKLLDLLSKNRVLHLEPTYDYRALRTLLSIDPRHPDYRRNLEDLVATIPSDPQDPAYRLRGTIELLIAVSDRSLSRRIDQLKALVDRFAKDRDSGALPQARFELAVAYQADNRSADARALFAAIQTEHRDSPWATEARRRLASTGQPGE